VAFTTKKKYDELEQEISGLPVGSYNQLVFRKFLKHKLACLGAIVLIALILFTFLGPLFVQTTYDEMDFSAIFAPPFSENHFLGTDEIGHDVFVRVMYGGRISLLVGIVSSVVSTLIGLIIGLVSGFLGGIWDKMLMRFVDIMLSIPLFPVLLILSLAFGSGVVSIILVLTVFGWMRVTRLVRGMTLSLRETEYVMASQTMGQNKILTILKHILPNVIPIVIVTTTLNLSYAILSESSLSYLGLGIQPPMPSWGNMLQGSMSYILGTSSGQNPWWLTFIPGFFIFITVLNVNFLGDGLRDALDPKFVSES